MHRSKRMICAVRARKKLVHSHIQPALGLDVSLHGDIPPGRPPDWKMIKEFSQHGASLIYLAKEGALGGANTLRRTFDVFKGRMSNFLIWTLPSPTHLFALKDEDSEICDVTSMVSKGYSIAFKQQMILPHMRKISEYDKRLLTLLQALEKLWNWRIDTFQEEVDFHVLQSCLGKDQLQGRQQKWGNNTPTCGFDIEHVKEENYYLAGASFHISTSLSLLGSLDPY